MPRSCRTCLLEQLLLAHASGTLLVSQWPPSRRTRHRHTDGRGRVRGVHGWEPAAARCGRTWPSRPTAWAPSGALSRRGGERTVVVGWLRTAAGDFHAFAYDLAADEPVMQDLGTSAGATARPSPWTAPSSWVGPRHRPASDARSPTTWRRTSRSCRTSAPSAGTAARPSPWTAPSSWVGPRHRPASDAFAYDLAADEPVSAGPWQPRRGLQQGNRGGRQHRRRRLGDPLVQPRRPRVPGARVRLRPRRPSPP